MPIRIVKGGLPSVARNNGAKHIKTPYVLFLDADIYLKDSSIITKCLATAIGGNYNLITCKFRTLNGDYNWVFRLFDIIQKVSSKFTPFAIGGFMLFKTEAFRAAGGFDEEAKIAEDYLLSAKIEPSKFKIVNREVYTSSRRFENKGVWYMIKLMLASWWNKNNPEWFREDHNYWK